MPKKAPVVHGLTGENPWPQEGALTSRCFPRRGSDDTTGTYTQLGSCWHLYVYTDKVKFQDVVTYRGT